MSTDHDTGEAKAVGPDKLLHLSMAVRCAVACSGIVLLGLQVVAPRLLHPYFGSGAEVAAAIVATALSGLSIGYFLSRRVTANPLLSIAKATGATGVWVLTIGGLLRLKILPDAAPDQLWLLPASTLLVGVPSLWLATVSPRAIALLGPASSDADHDDAKTTESAARVFGLGTAANVVGGLTTGLILAPFLGLSLSLVAFGLLMLAATAVSLTANSDGKTPPPVVKRLPMANTAVVPNAVTLGYLGLALYSGVISIVLQVNAARMLASLFGPTTGLWAAILSVSLAGLAVGYRLGAVVSRDLLRLALPGVVIFNGIWLFAATWAISLFEPTSGLSFPVIFTLTALAFGTSFALFGAESQLLIGAVWDGSGQASLSSAAALVFAASSVGGILGALLGFAHLIAVFGISALVKMTVVGYLLVVVLTWPHARRYVAVVAAIFLLLPMPDWQWRSQPGVLLLQSEGRYQTIRIYSDEASYVRFHLGPTYESEISLPFREPRFNYARTILQLAADVKGESILVVGGAGHGLSHAFERRGAKVTEVELDPIVRDASDEVFGPLDSATVVEDGRRFLADAPDDSYDVIVIDAFAGPRYVPPHLTTLEFFSEVQRALKPTGSMYMNFISPTSGAKSRPYQALGSTVSTAFIHSGNIALGGNNVVIGSNAPLEAPASELPSDGSPITDDRNPIDVFLELSR